MFIKSNSTFNNMTNTTLGNANFIFTERNVEIISLCVIIIIFGIFAYCYCKAKSKEYESRKKLIYLDIDNIGIRPNKCTNIKSHN